MKTALDNYELGKQQEVNADNFSFVIRDQYRFLCPECLESVTMVNGKSSKYFKHHKKTKSSIECDRRVESQGTKSITERVGLPLFLRKNNDKYMLYVGFRPLSDSLLNLTEKENACVKIIKKYSNQYQKYYINHQNFSSENIVYKKVEFLDLNNLEIQFNSTHSKTIQSIWSNYIETSITNRGALFQCGNSGGKIIRVGDCISTFKPYLWVKPKLYNISGPTFDNALNFKKVGNFTIEHREFEVYEGRIEVHSSEKNHFERVARYLQVNLKVFLLDSESTISAVWPPVVRTENGYQSNKPTHMYFIIHSNNAIPKVYLYNNNSATPYNIIARKIEDSFIGRTFISTIDQIINVDRRVISNGTYLRAKELNLICECKYSENLNVVSETITSSPCSITFVTNTSTDVYFIDINNHISKQKFEDGHITLNIEKIHKYVYILCNNHLIKVYSVINTKCDEPLTITQDIINSFKSSCNTMEVALTPRIVSNMQSLVEKDRRLKDILNLILQKNKIPLKVVRILEGK